MKNIEEIKNLGYTILSDILSNSECEMYKGLLEKSYLENKKYYADSKHENSIDLSNKTFEKVVYNLHNKNILWYKLFEHSKVLNILDYFLCQGSYNESEPYYLYNNSARCPLKENPGQQLHIDSNLPGINYCIIMNVMWVLDDFTEINGATRIVPGSHLNKTYAENGKIYDNELLIKPKKGSVVIFNANVWHGGGPNLDGSSRWAVLLGYSRWFIKPSFDYMKNMTKEIFEKLTSNQKALLGYNLIPPKDEFTRLRRRSENFEIPENYNLPIK